MKKSIKVWDIPTRVFHWAMALSFAGAWLTSESERNRDIHVALGYVMVGLIVFRLVWGLAGTHYARFNSFRFSAAELGSYLKSIARFDPVHYIGHNPAGALAIFLMLGLGLGIGGTGMAVYFEVGDEDLLSELHELAANLMMGVVAVHIAGVFISSFLHRENLPRAMVTGNKFSASGGGVSRSYPLLGVTMLLAIGGFLFWYLANR